MRHLRLSSPAFAAAALLSAVAFAPSAVSAQAQQPAQTPAPAQPSALPGPYKPVPIRLPPPLNDASFESFRQQVAQIVQKKDRAALARLELNFLH